MPANLKVQPSLWFGGNAKEAADFYTAIFPNSSINHIEYYTSVGQDKHRMPEGSVMLIRFELDGAPFTAINGPPMFSFNQAVSFIIDCEDSAEVDHYWTQLGEGGEPGPCGWMKDKFGLSWQVVPKQLGEWMKSGTAKQKAAMSETMMKMQKLDVEGLKNATATRPAGFLFSRIAKLSLEVDNLHEACEKLNICIIGVDRPGIGLSTFRPRFTLLDWPSTIQSLAGHLGFQEYRVVGCSGGGPFALACAREIPKSELKGTGIISGLAPPEAPLKGLSWERWIGFCINKWLPHWLLYGIYEHGLAKHARDPSQHRWRKIVREGIVERMSAEDQALMSEHDVERMILEIRDSCYGGSDGNILDVKLILGRWSFDLKSIDAKVKLWNGTSDKDTPIAMARWMASRLPNAELTLYPDETHFSLSHTRSEEILKDFISA
ncbi:uncharacterized protein PV09_04344 [Verruconis gallopava]|uniref:PhnB-like domain-containing protein n=1 Tax=Verruconis gallopava TaxID=253628 RepID=A0A0D1XPW6_9PEZI|nr:uncharacterized protein PV09_04344 [Verruconis gallopava]KIW04596.1 hypothetical protein PV09_04344 [Verruconis gallopava]